MLKKLFLMTACALFLVACNKEDATSSTDEALQKGLEAIADNDLGKAEGYFEIAAQEDQDDEAAQAYYKQIATLREGQKAAEAGDVEKAKSSYLLVLDQPNGSKSINAKAEEMLKQLESKKEASATPEVKPEVEPQAAPQTVTADVIKDVSGMRFVQLANKDGNVRSKPDINSSVAHSGKQGDVFAYLQEKVKTADDRTWYKIEYGSGSIGYISSATSNLTNEQPHYVRVNGSDTNVRAEPSINSAVIYTGKSNEVFYYSYDKTHTSDGRTWLHVTLGDGTYGYVSQKVATMTTKSAPVVSSTPTPGTVEITSADGNIRAEPSLNSPVIYSAQKGDTFEYLYNAVNTSDGRTWYEVNVYGQSGYISKAVGKLHQ